jgi:hypothetical protein
VAKIIRKAARFAAAAARHAAGGFRKVAGEVYARRLALCLACPQRDAATDTCRLCGCSLQDARGRPAKLRWASEGCPAGKWGREPATPDPPPAPL